MPRPSAVRTTSTVLPDMRLPIAYALAYPERVGTPFGRIDWSELGRLDFEPPDHEAFPCLGLAYEAGRLGETAPAWLNAANEVAVEAFRAGRLEFRRIVPTIADVLALHDVPSGEQLTVDDVLAADGWARNEATRLVGS